MVLNLEMTGIDEMFTALDTTVQRVNRGVNELLKKSAEPVREEMKKTIPISSEMKHPDEGHAVDDIRITNVKSSQGGFDKKVDVGFKVTEWRMWFLEFGTIYIAPRHYVEKAGLAARKKVLAIQIKELRALLKQRGVF